LEGLSIVELNESNTLGSSSSVSEDVDVGDITTIFEEFTDFLGSRSEGEVFNKSFVFSLSGLNLSGG